MIVKAVQGGTKTAGLLYYLYGPGKGAAAGGTVHVNPRTIAAWDGRPGHHQPGTARSGRPSVMGLARLLDTPLAFAERSPAKHVQHIIVANHPDDPVLSDEQWADVATKVMQQARLSNGPNDPDGVRWIAVRHDDTSVHIVYTAARESGGKVGYINYSRAWQNLRHDYEAPSSSRPRPSICSGRC